MPAPQAFRAAWASEVALAFLLSAAIAQAQNATPVQGARALVSPERAARREALLSQMFPGGCLDWDRDEIVFPDGRRKAVGLGFYAESTMRPDGEMFVMAGTKPDDAQNKSIEALQSLRQASVDGPSCKLSFLRLDRSGKVLGFKQAGPDISGVFTACSRADLENAHASAGALSPKMRGQPEPAWPWVFVQYSSVHALPDAWAIVTWAAVFDSEAERWVSRLPVYINGARRKGGEFVFAVQNDRGEARDGNWSFHGLTGRGDTPAWTARTRCAPAKCVVAPELVIDAALSSLPRTAN